MDLLFSFIVPVYNRPNEIKELLASISEQTYSKYFEVVIVEDGSSVSSEKECQLFDSKLNIKYLFKDNSGPGDSRNYGMLRAKGNYFIVLDSDCILPPQYLEVVAKSLQEDYVDCYGGPDAAHASFSDTQKAINYAMTSFFTTGGIRGKKSSVGKFQPRSFNMGISKKAFEDTKGYGNIHPGEDPDLTIRLWNKEYSTKLIEDAFVYHKRRVDWSKFYVQVNKFGMVRPILNKWHPETAKLTYWFPSVFCVGLLIAIAFLILGYVLPLLAYAFYFGLIFVDSLLKNKNVGIAFKSWIAVVIQFSGYGYGFLKATVLLSLSKKAAQELFPKLFFKNNE
ncbi:MAG: glycosyltransferase [Cellulophaga sp.]